MSGEKCNKNWLLLVVLMLLASCSQAPEVPGGPATKSADILSEIGQRWGNEAQTKQLALDTFATLIGPIRGGHRLAGEVPEESSGTIAIFGLLAFFDQLDEDQRETAQQALRAAGSDADQTTNLQVLVNLTTDKMKARFPTLALPKSVLVVLSTVDDGSGFASAPATLASGELLDQEAGPLEVCAIYVRPGGLRLYEKVKSGERPLWNLEALIVHELFHCAQFAAAKDVKQFLRDNVRMWVLEGSAAWAQFKYMHIETGTPNGQALPGFDKDFTGAWAKYFGKPEDDAGRPPRSLFSGAYEAVGFFGHIEEMGQDPVTTIMRMVVAFGEDGDEASRDAKAFSASNPAQSDEFVARWAMGMSRQAALGPKWDTDGPDITSYIPKLENNAIVDKRLSFDTAPGATDRQQLDISEHQDKVLAIDTRKSYGAIFWKSGLKGVEEEFGPGDSGEQLFCLDPDGCNCPPDSIEAEADVLSPPPGSGCYSSGGSVYWGSRTRRNYGRG